MPRTIKVGVITQAQGAHLPDYFAALAKIDEAESVALADASGKSVDLARTTLGEKLKAVYKDPAELLRRFQPHMVVVSLEAVAAPPVIDAALDAGCHVFAEKPSCTRAEDFEKLTRKAQQQHRHLMMAFANRSHAPVREARRLIQAGMLGKIYDVELHLVTDQTRLRNEEYRKSWLCSKARAGGGQLIWVGIHWLDLALYITGLKIKQVTGFAGVVGGQPIDIEDSVALSMRFDNGSFGTMTSGYYLDKGYQSHVQVWGEQGWLRFSPVEELPLEWYSRKEGKNPQVERFEYPKGERGYLPFLKSAVRASAGLEEAPVSAEEGLHVLRSIFAFYEAVQTGRVQTVVEGVDPKRRSNMQTQFVNPRGLSPTIGWTHVVTATGGKTVHISGQVSVNERGEVVGKGDLKAQTQQAYENLKIALSAVGATFRDVIKMNTYVVGLKPEQVPILREVRSRYVSADKPPASTLVGVPALVGADWLIEIEAIAVISE